MAQLVEHIVHIDEVVGSSPIATTINKDLSTKGDFLLFTSREVSAARHQPLSFYNFIGGMYHFPVHILR